MTDNQERIAAMIGRAQELGSSAKTLRGAGRFLARATKPRWAKPFATRWSRQQQTRSSWRSWEHMRRANARYMQIAERMSKALCLPTRDALAGAAKLPKYLTSAERQAVAPTQAAVAAWRARPVFARAYWEAPAGTPAREIRQAEKNKGITSSSQICARWAEEHYDWGRLRVHSRGELAVHPSKVGMYTTGSNTDWSKKSTLDRRVDYCLIYPRKSSRGNYYRGYLVTPSGCGKAEQVVYRSARHLMIGDDIYPFCAAKTEPAPWPAHIQRRMLEMVTPGVIRVDYDRAQKLLVLVDALGEHYHVPAIRTMSDALRHVREAVQAFRKRRSERKIKLEPARIFVSLDDSYQAGNCRPMSDRFASELWSQIGAEGPCAVRADVILAARNDSYTMRACMQAACRQEVA